MTDGVEGSSSSRIRGIRAADTALADRIQVKQTTPICWHISEYRAGNRLYGLIKDERVKANGNKHDRMSVAYPIRPFIVARQKPSICPKNISIRVAFATWSSNQRWSPMSPAIAPIKAQPCDGRVKEEGGFWPERRSHQCGHPVG